MNQLGIVQKLAVAFSLILFSVSGLVIVFFANVFQSVDAQIQKLPNTGAPIATSGNNVYIAWPSNLSKHWNVFFAKSVDNGKTFENTITVSAPNKGGIADRDVEIAASGSNVYLTWWTNKTGTFMPVFTASNDTGESFGKIITLNGTK